MGQVPQDEGAGVVDGAGDPLGVGEVAGAVGDVAEGRERRAGSDGGADLVEGDAGGGVGLDPAQGEAAFGGDAFEDEAVGGEVVGVADDLVAALAQAVVHGGADELVEEDGGGVGDDGLPGGGAEGGAADAVAEVDRPVHPAAVGDVGVAAPALDEPAAPLVVDEAVDGVGGGLEGAAEGVAVEVGGDGGGGVEEELVAVAGEGVGGVEGGGAGGPVRQVPRQLLLGRGHGCPPGRRGGWCATSVPDGPCGRGTCPARCGEVTFCCTGPPGVTRRPDTAARSAACGLGSNAPPRTGDAP